MLTDNIESAFGLSFVGRFVWFFIGRFHCIHCYLSGSCVQVVGVSSGGVVVSPLRAPAISPTQHISSPTSTSMATSPLLTTTFSPPLAPPLASPSPTHSGASTPRGCGVPTPSAAAYPQPVLYPPYSPIYIISNSPLPSPLASPKTSSKWQHGGSYSSVNQGAGEFDSLLKWLKSLRLHKYHPKFEHVTYDEVSVPSVRGYADLTFFPGSRGQTTYQI